MKKLLIPKSSLHAGILTGAIISALATVSGLTNGAEYAAFNIDEPNAVYFRPDVAPDQQVYSTGAFNSICQQKIDITGGVTGYSCRLVKNSAGGLMRSVIPSLLNWRRQHDTQVVTDGPAFVMERFAVSVNNVRVEATRGGVPGPWAVPAGANDFRFDEILASAFGLPAGIPSSTPVVFTTVRTYPENSWVNAHFQYLRNALTSQESWAFNPAETSVSSVSSNGVMTFSGAAPVQMGGIAFDIMLLGTYVNGPKRVYIAYGDSITQGIGNNTFNNNGHNGWFWRAMLLNDFAGINMSVGGSLAPTPLVDARELYWTRFANRAVVYYANNDMGSGGNGVTAAAMGVRVVTLRDAILNAPLSRVTAVVACAPCNRTVSGNAYADEDGQAYISAGWGPGGNVQDFRLLLPSLGFAAVLEFTDTYGEVDKRKWKGNTPPLALDSVGHPANQGHIVMGAQGAPILAAV